MSLLLDVVLQSDCGNSRILRKHRNDPKFGIIVTWLPLHCNPPKRKKTTDVDAITRQFIPYYAFHLSIYFILRQVDRLNRFQAYSYEYFKENIPVRTKPTAEAELLPTLVLTLSGINAYTNNTLTNITPLSNPSPLLLFRIQYSPVLILASPTIQYHTSLPYQKRISNK